MRIKISNNLTSILTVSPSACAALSRQSTPPPSPPPRYYISLFHPSRIPRSGPEVTFCLLTEWEGRTGKYIPDRETNIFLSGPPTKSISILS